MGTMTDLRLLARKPLAPPGWLGERISPGVGMSFKRDGRHAGLLSCDWRNILIYSRCRLKDLVSFHTSVITIFIPHTAKFIRDTSQRHQKGASKAHNRITVCWWLCYYLRQLHGKTELQCEYGFICIGCYAGKTAGVNGDLVSGTAKLKVDI